MKDNKKFLMQFGSMETKSSLLLMVSAIAAMVVANSPWSSLYSRLIETPMSFQLGHFILSKPLLLWVNDGLMAVFFMLIGLELKREFLEGELSDLKSIILPLVGAAGGMMVPALIYYFFNQGDSIALSGWAIPAATDIAFALGILALLGNRVPLGLKIFLTSLAIFDDIGAIIIIAVFYTSNLSLTALVTAGFCLVVLWALNRGGVLDRSAYFIIGLMMWVALLKSGVHATLAGILLACFIPMRSSAPNDHSSPLRSLEKDLHSTVAFFILPVFAFCNSGIEITDLNLQDLLHSVTLGIALGLFIGNQVGVFVFCAIAVKLRLAELPKGVSWLTLYGVSALCGVGFTMSLFIGSLAFEETGINLLFDERVGIFIGSIFSGCLGYFVLRYSLDKRSL